MIDERFTEAAALFHQASRLLSDLTELAKRRPDLDVEKLRARLDGALRMVMMDLRIRDEGQITDALMPPESKFWLTGEAWLNSLDNPPRKDAPSEDNT